MPTFDQIEDTTTSLAAPGNEITSWTVDDIKKSDILVFRDSQSQYVDSVIAPNGLQVGLLDQNFLTDLLVTGHITGSGVIYSELGFSGSLQTLVDGSDYLIGADGISITNNEDGSITISGGGSTSGSRLKTVFNLASQGSFPTAGLFFADYDYSPHMIDVYHNGELLTSGAVGDASADFYLGVDTQTGGVINFNFDTTTSDDITVIVGAGGSGGGSGGTTYSAGTGLSLSGNIFNVATDGSTTSINSQNQIQVLKTPNQLIAGNGLAGANFDGSSVGTFSVNPVSGSPITVTGAGVGFSMNPVPSLQLQGTDEVLIQQGNSIGKITIDSLIAAAGGTPGVTNAAYLVAESSSALSNERVVGGGDGITIDNDAQNGAFSISVAVEQNGGLEFVSGKLAVKAGDFVGFGLSESNGVINIDTFALAGVGLVANGNVLDVDFGETDTTVAKGSNEIHINPGDGLNLGGSAVIGRESSTINLEVKSTDIQGLGLSVSNNNLDVYLSGINGISILSGSSGELVIDASAAIDEATALSNIVGGSGITSTFDPATKEYTISLDYLNQNNIFEDATDGTAVTLDEDNDRILVYDADAQEVIQIAPSQIAGSGGGKPVVGTQGITATDTGDQFDLEVDYDDTDNVVTSAHDPIQDWEIDESNDKILVYDADQEQVIKISPQQFSGGAGKIGDAEDGTYTDGLFTDFNPDTPTGTAIDRFNEILKALAPAPAPDLFEIDENISDGKTAILSFGSSNVTVYENVADLDATLGKDVNESYGVYSNNDNFVRGIYTSFPTLTGDLNETVTAGLTQPTGLTNYSANAFANGDVGSLVLEVNGVEIHTIDLTDPATGTGDPPAGQWESKVDGSGFTNVSVAKAGQFDSGASFDTFKHRTARFIVDPFHQRQGWNYVKVKHVKTAQDIIVTNHVQWVVDDNGEQPVVTGEVATFTGSGSFFLSGVEYFTGGTVNYQASIENYYKFVHALNNISFNTSGTGAFSGLNYSIPTQQVQPIDTANAETHEKVIVIDKTANVTSNYILDGGLTTSISLAHPTKNNISNAGNVSISEILMYSETPASTITSETFVDENFRVTSGNYALQNDVTTASWDSEVHMDNGGYTDGLQFYNGELKSPKKTANNGDYLSLQHGPVGNPDYSGVTGTRTLYRKFQNTQGTVQDWSWNVQGSTNLSPESTNLTTNNVHVSFKFPSNGVDNTGWMDACDAFSYQATSDGDGGYIGTFDGTANATNYFTIGTGSIGNNEWIVAKVSADSNWSGDLESFTVSFGATGTVNPSSDLETLNMNESPDSTNANLSWGDILNLPGYNTVENDGGNEALNANDTCVNTSNRLGTIGPVLSSISGTLNIGKPGDGQNYPQNAFGGDAGNLGTLRIIVNGNEIHSEDLSTFGSGDTKTSGTGFNLTAATVGRDSNGLPNYNYFYRTGTYTVATVHQAEGWNWAKVEHEVDGVIHDTNYVEWINDSSNPVLTPSGEAIDTITDSDISYLSGVQYFESPSGKFRFTMANAYKYVYSSSTSAVRISTASGVSVTSMTVDNGQNTVNGSSVARLPALDPTVVNAYDADVTVEANWNYTAGTSIPGGSIKTISLRGQVDHPLVGAKLTAAVSETNWLVKTINDTSTEVNENFSGEDYRLPDGTYANQADVNVTWDSTESLSGADAAYNTGLIVYNGQLRYPSNAGLGTDPGDFRDKSEGGSLNAPIGNPDYSGVTGERVYYRKIRNNTGSSQSNFTLNLQGSGSTIGTGSSATGNELKIYVKMPANTANPVSQTGFLDIAIPFTTLQYNDGDGALKGTLDTNIDSSNSNQLTLQTNSVQDDEWIIIKIVASSAWSGYVSNVSVLWG